MLDVVAHNNLRMRGQAFVSFPSAEIAKKAMKDVQRFPLYSKPMVWVFVDYLAQQNADVFKQISFARTRSDAVVKRLDGNRFDDHKVTREERKRAPSLQQILTNFHILLTRANAIHESIEIKIQGEKTGCRKSVYLFFVNITPDHFPHFQF